jgi:sugar/nucleoside kinase (ribokinase family)
VYSYLTNSRQSWEDHFRFAAKASAFKIQRLGNEAGLPALSDIERIEQEFQWPASAAGRPARAAATR